ncbi:MAG TPA: glycoside hydrolase family 3 C-terminal domain-containing protein [Trebonia sp.]|jgi:hypothetical protein
MTGYNKVNGDYARVDPGMDPAEAAMLARGCDVAIVFAIRVEGEGFDNPGLALPWGQDAVIEAVAAANPDTIVVLETGNPVAMPWLDKVRAIVQAWYPGQAGGQAIAEILTVTNTGGRAGADTPQLYLTDAAGDPRMRLLGFDRVELQPGESRTATVTADPRLLARYDADAGQWHIAEGSYQIALGRRPTISCSPRGRS